MYHFYSNLLETEEGREIYQKLIYDGLRCSSTQAKLLLEKLETDSNKFLQYFLSEDDNTVDLILDEMKNRPWREYSKCILFAARNTQSEYCLNKLRIEIGTNVRVYMTYSLSKSNWTCDFENAITTLREAANIIEARS